MSSRGARVRVGLLVCALACLAGLSILAGTAGAAVVKLADGRLAGITPVAGLNPAALPGNVARAGLPSTLSTTDTGLLSYHNGPVLHNGSSPYLIFWDPNHEISQADRDLYARFFSDAAAASGGSSNVYGVDRQFTDGAGFANYAMSYGAGHSIDDPQAYPTTGNCTQTPAFGETVCLTDTQITTEIGRLITADNLPTGIAAQAPIYFIVTPPDVNSCQTGAYASSCADNVFCAYHSHFTSGGAPVLYANIPTVLAVNDPKGCQADGSYNVQAPNGNAVVDDAIKYISHEDNETITDPLGNAWYDGTSGNENGDECNAYSSPSSPSGGSNVNAYTPTLGGTDGSLYNQLINGDHYYTQSEWSNGNLTCELRPSSNTLSAAFTAPASAGPSSTVSFDPSASSNGGTYTSTTWDFGDGTISFARSAPGTITHSFTAPGVYNVKLTEVDQYGNLSTVTHSIAIGTAAAFSFAPPHPGPSDSVSFDGRSSSGPGLTYDWNWGDGSTHGTGSQPTHSYAVSGTYQVTLTVTDSSSTTAMSSQNVVVDPAPSAAFSSGPAHPGPGDSVSFTSSSGGTGLSYDWNWGDGSTHGTSATPTHSYTSANTYTVTLTVTDEGGHTSTISHPVVVDPAPAAAFGSTPAHPGPSDTVSFDGSGSSGTALTYDWNWGDGSTHGTGATPTHAYATSGTKTVTLTVTDEGSHTSSVTHSVTVDPAPSASFTAPGHVEHGSQVAVDGSGSAGTGLTYDWNWGDGSTHDTGSQPTHSYTTPGSDTITLTVTDEGGHTSQTTHGVTVDPTPSAAFGVTTTDPQINAPVTFDGSTSSGAGLSYDWNWGDGSTHGSGSAPSHTYATPASYTVTLQVTDRDGAQVTQSHPVTVANAPTAAFSSSPQQPVAGSAVNLDGSASSETNGAIASYHWDFGDGTSATGAQPSHTFAAAGTPTVTLTVTDQAGRSASVAHAITVAAVAVAVPTPTPTPAPTPVPGPHGTPSAAITVATANPAAGAAVSFSAANSTDSGSTLTAEHWNFGDGTSANGMSPSHTYAAPGSYTVTLTVADATGAGATAARALTVAAASIVKASAKPSGIAAAVRLTISGPGTLIVAGHHYAVTHAGVTTIKVKLSQAQRSTLHHHHKLVLHLKTTFTPAHGHASARTLTITLKT